MGPVQPPPPAAGPRASHLTTRGVGLTCDEPGTSQQQVVGCDEPPWALAGPRRRRRTRSRAGSRAARRQRPAPGCRHSRTRRHGSRRARPRSCRAGATHIRRFGGSSSRKACSARQVLLVFGSPAWGDWAGPLARVAHRAVGEVSGEVWRWTLPRASRPSARQWPAQSGGTSGENNMRMR